jgi:hypothetical protein
MLHIEESDWRHLRDLQPVLLDRCCRRILSAAEEIVAKHEEAAHPRYLAMYKLIHDRDRELADMFNDVRRSNAFVRILLLRRNGLFTDEEFAGFGAETKSRIIALQGS